MLQPSKTETPTSQRESKGEASASPRFFHDVSLNRHFITNTNDAITSAQALATVTGQASVMTP